MPGRPTPAVPTAPCAAGRCRPTNGERRRFSPPIYSSLAGSISEEPSPMATPLNRSLTPSVRSDAEDHPKSEERDDQDATRSVPDRFRVLLWACLWVIGGFPLAGIVIWLVLTIKRENVAKTAQENFR